LENRVNPPEQQKGQGGRYYVGPSGWSYEDWKGVVYPRGGSSRFDHLAYIATYFTAVEVNVSFYRNVTVRMAQSWAHRVAERDTFRFTFKLHQAFTDGLRPILEAGRFGCLLMQFPWSFRRSEESTDWLRRLTADFAECRPVIELRHTSWDVPETAELLREMHAGYCNIDQPQLPQCLGPSNHVTSRTGYVRLHGRRRDTWFADKVPSYERYNYLYSDSELKDWVPRIQRIAAETDQIYVFANNHYRGQGPANALQLRAFLEESKVDVPPTLAEAVPTLKSIQRQSPKQFPESLF
jgi:uncharacterized protein YecE (DUF72 family)